jgi:hypothetical protein
VPAPRESRRRQRGLTLIAALIAAAVLALAAYFVMQSFDVFSRGKLGLQQRLQGDEALVAAAVGIQQADFSEIVALCRDRGIMNAPAPRDSVCVNAGVFNAALGSPPAPVLSTTLEVLRDVQGRPSPQGNQCFELLHCRHLASGRILEVLLQGNWVDGARRGSIVQRRLSFRRTRW